MYRFLLSRRWLALVAVVLLAVPACVRLGIWQLHRYEQRRDANALIRANLAAAPRPVEELAPVAVTIRPQDAWRQVRITGSYDTAHQLVVRNRPYGGSPGFYVLTPLLTPAGPGVLVNRGWVPAPTDGSISPKVPSPPAGAVTVIGRLRPAESQHSYGPRDGPRVPAGQVVRIDVPRIARSLPYALRAGYVELVDEQPRATPAPQPLDPPEPGTGPHLAYALQWWLFAGLAAAAPVILARREAADRRAGSARRSAGRSVGRSAGRPTDQSAKHLA